VLEEEVGPYSTTKTLRLKSDAPQSRTSQSLSRLLASSSTIRTCSTAFTSKDTLFPPNQTLPNPANQPGIRILALDATHSNPILIRSTNIILQKIEDTIVSHGYPPNTPLCDYFNIICGTAEGGLLALAIGAFRLTAKESHELFKMIAGWTFLRSWAWEDALNCVLKERYRGYMSRRLEKKVRKFIRKRFGAGNEKVSMHAVNSGCHT